MEVRRIRYAATKNRVARVLFEHFVSREDGGSETTVDSLVTALWQTEVALKRAEVVKILQFLASLGCGKFTPGRHGKPSRMTWAFDLRALARLALEEGDCPASEHAASEGDGYAALWSAHRAELEDMTESRPYNETVNE